MSHYYNRKGINATNYQLRIEGQRMEHVYTVGNSYLAPTCLNGRYRLVGTYREHAERSNFWTRLPVRRQQFTLKNRILDSLKATKEQS